MATSIVPPDEGPRRRESRPFVRHGLQARTIYFPAGVLAQIDTRPGQLVEVLTLALSQFLVDGKAVTQ